MRPHMQQGGPIGGSYITAYIQAPICLPYISLLYTFLYKGVISLHISFLYDSDYDPSFVLKWFLHSIFFVVSSFFLIYVSSFVCILFSYNLSLSGPWQEHSIVLECMNPPVFKRVKTPPLHSRPCYGTSVSFSQTFTYHVLPVSVRVSESSVNSREAIDTQSFVQ